jgi:hypothetical protein
VVPFAGCEVAVVRATLSAVNRRLESLLADRCRIGR